MEGLGNPAVSGEILVPFLLVGPQRMYREGEPAQGFGKIQGLDGWGGKLPRLPVGRAKTLNRAPVPVHELPQTFTVHGTIIGQATSDLPVIDWPAAPPCCSARMVGKDRLLCPGVEAGPMGPVERVRASLSRGQESEITLPEELEAATYLS